MYVNGLFTSTLPWDLPELSGSAHFYLPSEGYEWIIKLDDELHIFSAPTRAAITSDRINLDLIIDNTVFVYSEFDQVTPHVGDTFSHNFFGKKPVVLNVSATLMDSQLSMGKTVLMELYRWVFRASRVAKTGIVPCLVFRGCLVQGAMLGIDLREVGTQQDRITVGFSFIVLGMYYERLTEGIYGGVL